MAIDPCAAAYRAHLDALSEGTSAALAAHAWDALVIDAGVQQPKSRFDDQSWPFRPAAAFAHWLPLSAPGSALVARPGARPALVWHRPTDFWEAPHPPESDEFTREMDVHEVTTAAEVRARVRDLVPPGRVAVLVESAGRAATVAPDADQNPPALVAALDDLRATKTAYEVACIAEANARAARGHDAVRAAFGAGGFSELDLHLRYLAATGQDDPETPYKNIVAQGAHAATLHHVAYARTDDGAASLLVDAGATRLGYHSDITRTWVRGAGVAVDAFAGLVAAVDLLQQRLCDGVARGRAYEELHDEAHLHVGLALREVGIWRGSPAEAVAKEVTAAFFPHGLGHSLGLQTHDVGCARVRPRADNPWLRNTRRIDAGQVFTVEPGIYFIPALIAPLRQGPHAGSVDWATVDALAPFGGVRIEDDLHVKGDAVGHVNLTRAVLPAGGGPA